MSGSIPDALGSLPKLERLYLGYNKLTGPIPYALGNLSMLESLSFRNNRLSDEIPVELADLVNLRSLNLDANRLSGGIPKEISSLLNLTYLVLSRNQLTGPIPPEIGNLNDLQELWLEHNELSGQLPPELGDMAALDRVRVAAGNEFTGCIPAMWENLADHDLHLVDLRFCTPERLLPVSRLPVTGGHVTPTNALLILMIIGAAAFAAGLCTVLRGERSTSPS